MINPNNTENFYIQSTKENYANNIGFNPNAVLEDPDRELDAIEVLTQMAKLGKINPWDIDLADIADKYMLHLAESKSNNLRITGRALFFLAVLLKIKSNVLAGINPEEFNPEPEINPEYDESDDSRFSDDLYYNDYFPDNVIPLESVIQRRTSVKQNRKRVVTLRDLIRQLEFYEKLEQKEIIKSRIERAKHRVKSYANMTSADIVNLAQEEYIQNSVKILHENLTKIFETEEKVELKTLTLLGVDKTSAYMALLFLTADGEFDLKQEEFYSDLYVVPATGEEISEEELRAV